MLEGVGPAAPPALARNRPKAAGPAPSTSLPRANYIEDCVEPARSLAPAVTMGAGGGEDNGIIRRRSERYQARVSHGPRSSDETSRRRD